jgi:hypothetical protein
MRALFSSAARARLARRLGVLLVAVCLLGFAASWAWGFWSSGAAIGNAAAAATSLHQHVTVSWGAVTAVDGSAVSGYVIARYDAQSGVQQTIGAGCSGVITATTCTEAGLVPGAWTYTVTPTMGANWRGAESPHSGVVDTGLTTLTLAQSTFGPPFPTTTTGAITGFLPGEGITYKVDGTPVVGSPATANVSGAATITSLTIPAGLSDGTHTVSVIGNDPVAPSQAQASILIDTTPPTVTPIITPAPNAAGWNNTSPVEVDLAASDGGGSGLAYVKYTTDGTNPITSPTAQQASDTLTATQTTTYKFYAVDLAGNASAVQATTVQIDTAAPVPTGATLVNVQGGAYLNQAAGITYYRGAVAGSFQLQTAAIDPGGAAASGLASASDTALNGTTAGFTINAGTVTTPAGGPFVLSPVSWVAGTTSNPVGTVVIADVAGNSIVFPAQILNDSAAPSGGSIDATGLVGPGGRYSTSMTINLALAQGSDSGSGLANGSVPADLPDQLMRASAPLSSSDGIANATCGAYGGYVQVQSNNPPATVSNTVPSNNTCYRYEYLVADHVGNIATYTSPDIKVETAAAASLTPSAVTLTPVSGTGSQSVSGSTVYYNPAQSGSFNVVASASSASSGVAQMSFPAITGFTGGGAVSTPFSGTSFRSTYAWSTNGSSPSPGGQSLSATDNAGQTATNANAFSVIADSAGPTGGSVDAIGLGGTGGRYSISTTLSVGFSPGSDSGSGLATSGAQLWRASAALSSSGSANGTCGTYGAYTQIGANNPTSPVGDIVPADKTCYRYEYIVADNVGNQTIYTSPDIKVDTTAPPTPALAFSALSNTYWSNGAATLYYNPTATSGAFTVTASSNDTTSGTTGFGFPTLPAGWSASSGGTGIQNYSWSAANPTAPSGPKTVTTTNNAGSQSSASFTATPDSAPPSGGSISYTGGLYTTPTVNVSFTAGTDSGSGVNTSSGALQRSAASLTGTTCGTFGSYATIAANATSPYTDTVPANHSCYQYRYLISDQVGNQAIYTSSSIVQLATTAASIGTVTFQNAFSDNTVDGTGTVSLPTPQNGKNTACLTATGNTATLPLLSCAPAIDTQGSGTLRLTNAVGNQVGGIFDTTSFPTSNGIDVKFNTYQYGGTNADGIAFLLAAVDPANPVAPTTLASSGGALGYSATGTLSGLTNAYLGIGLDVFGNFSNKVYEGTGCTDLPQMTTAEAGAVAVRGPGNGHVGYCGVATSYTLGGKANLHGTTRANSVVPVEMLINPTSTSFTSASGLTVAAGAYEVVFTPIGGAARTLTGPLPTVPAGLYPSATWLNASGIPNQLAFGFDASTGGSTDIHEISNVQVATFSSVPQLAVNTTSYSAATPSAGAPVTYGVTANVVAGANETSPISVTQTVPTGVVPVGASGSGWTCQSPQGQSITCTTTGSFFTGGTVLPVLNVVAIVTGSSVTSALVQSGSSATAASVDSNTGSTSSATAGTLPSAPSSITVAPSIGPTAGGGSVTVSGTNIGSATAIEIGTTAQQQAGTPVTLLPCPGLPAAGCFTSFAGSLVISSMPALTNPANVSVTVVTSGLAAAGSYVYANAPATPATPTATAGVTTATVTWVAPASNGSPITGYIITPYRAGIAQTPQAFDASTTTRTLTGLTHNSSYTFTVAAVNLAGTSNASSNSTSVTP